MSFRRRKSDRNESIGMCVLTDPIILANTIIYRAIRKGKPVTSLKLHKLMYLMYKEYGRLTDEPLFPERFETWDYGPAVSSIQPAFEKYGNMPILSYGTTADGKKIVLSLDKENTPLYKAFNNVWKKYFKFKGKALAKMTHQMGSAWWCAYQCEQRFLDDEVIFEEDDLTDVDFEELKNSKRRAKQALEIRKDILFGGRDNEAVESMKMTTTQISDDPALSDGRC